jgi:phosphoribosyl 1,2-cyclic phosphodiesterase
MCGERGRHLLYVLRGQRRYCPHACDPHSFIVTNNSIQIGIFTDIGTACEHVIKHFKKCHAAFLETNYDEGMLIQWKYPYHLKKRIRSDDGHLSNDEALQLFIAHKPSYMSHLILSHLSKNNNCPQSKCNLSFTLIDSL